MATAEQLKALIKSLKEAGLDGQAAEKELELAKLTGNPAPVAVAASGITDDDWDAAGSKFPAVGVHPVEFGVPTWKTVNVSLQIPFTITDGADKGKTDNLYPGVEKKSFWKFKEIIEACGLSPVKVNGVIDFMATAQQLYGQKAKIIYTESKDTRPVSEGGTGGVYSKAAKAIPINAEAPEGLF
jgi:hypothetical protein